MKVTDVVEQIDGSGIFGVEFDSEAEESLFWELGYQEALKRFNALIDQKDLNPKEELVLKIPSPEEIINLGIIYAIKKGINYSGMEKSGISSAS